MVALTLVYVVATLCLVWLSGRQLRFAARLERNRLRPYVNFELTFEDHSVFARMFNSGQTAARDVKIDINPKLQYVYGGENAVPRKEGTKKIPFIERGVPMLAPGTEIKALVGFIKRVRSGYPEMRFVGTISYTDLGHTTYSEPFVVDLDSIVALAYRGTKNIEDVAKQLEEISKTLDKLATGYNKPLVRIISEREHIEREEAEYSAVMQQLPSRPNETSAPEV